MFIEQGSLLNITAVVSDPTVLIAAGLTSLVVVLAAVWWLRSRSQLRADGAGDVRPSKLRLLGNVLMVAGVLLILVAGFTFVQEMTDPSRSLPRPVALQSAGADASGVSAPAPTATAEPAPTPTPTAPAPSPTSPPALVPAEVTPDTSLEPTITPEPTSTPEPPTPTPEPEPQEVVAPSSGSPARLPDRMVIPSIGMDSNVQETGTYWLNGEWHWQTQPWAISYYSVTGTVGENGNAAFSGHVATQNYGNVFTDLYKVELGDTVEVYAGGDKFTYVVDSVRLVPPTETSVMNPTPDPVVTLITCAGDWIESERDYTERLIVRATMER